MSRTMSAELPTPPAEKPRKRKRGVKSNSAQILLFVTLTVILTIAAVWGGRIWLKNSETLVFAVGDPSSPEARFAARLAAVLKNNTSRLQLKIGQLLLAAENLLRENSGACALARHPRS